MRDTHRPVRVGQRWRIAAWSAAAALILAPLVAMQFTTEVNWGMKDLAFAIALVIGTGLLFESAVRLDRSWAYRGAAGLALAAAFLLLWGNAAVGFIGNEGNRINALFYAPPAVALAGTILVRGRPLGMAYAMVASGMTQVGVAVGAFLAGAGFAGPLTVFFTAMWLASAALFRKAKSPLPERAPVAGQS